ncbi:MAG: ABC transporter permease subunit [Phycisphaeraceae bacterium]|nr:ABC transporter permease subunit [Phycisphaeraceae bacterium]MCB9847344.1 ABC transporter permease subunit [Phycisphaeraceae bacterium]
MTTTTTPIMRRRGSRGGRGEPMVWVSLLALGSCVAMIVALIALIVGQGFSTFWPRPIEELTLTSGEILLGVPVRTESAGETDNPDGPPARRTLFRVGNKEITGQPFRWIPESEIVSSTLPTDAVLVERTAWGVWLGRLEQILEVSGDERTVVAEGDVAWAQLPAALKAARHRAREIESLREGDVGEINAKLESARLKFRVAQLRHEDGDLSDEQLKRAEQTLAERSTELQAEYDGIRARIDELDREDSRSRVVFREPGSGAISPLSSNQLDEPMRLTQVVRVVRTNNLSLAGRLGVYCSRWWEFLSTGPREANTEGGVLPVILGTVALTMLLSVIVVPLGAVAAVYLREYAHQGFMTSAVRIAVNNLAGVPSIVYGVFGLGFFCYSVGGWIDTGPRAPMSTGSWWTLAAGAGVALAGTITLMMSARTAPGVVPSGRQRTYGMLAKVGWLSVALLVMALLATTPYFKGFYRAMAPTPKFGAKGLLWSALTLALLTLPVVIVATEEAIAAVPRSMREASAGCGASKWQTIQRIVLPRAAPGMMTGMILAMARGAGEVAPLMLVGAVKQTSDSVISAEPPFVHLDRPFMHLGFHIYDLGFQSPDSEAARPTVWTTTLLLIVIVLMLNTTAILLRGRLRRRFRTGAF